MTEAHACEQLVHGELLSVDALPVSPLLGRIRTNQLSSAKPDAHKHIRYTAREGPRHCKKQRARKSCFILVLSGGSGDVQSVRTPALLIRVPFFEKNI